MKKSFQKSLIAASVGAVMFAAAGTASANSLLFPYFTTASGAQSVLSLSNTGTIGPVASTAAQRIHYVYNYGAECTHFDANGSMTANDTLSHSIAAPGAGGFGKVVGSDTSTPVYLPLANQTGFLVVTNNSATSGNASALRGSMAIVDPATGLVVSYAGIDNALDTSGPIAGGNATVDEGNFAFITDRVFPLTALPASVVNTSWFTVVAGNMNFVINNGLDWRATGSFSNGGNVFNNDEVAFSGTQTRAVTCSGTVLSSQLATAAQGAAVGPNGGLINATFNPGTATPALGNVATGVIMAKLQTVLPSVGAPFAGRQFLHREVGAPAPAPAPAL